MRRNPPPAISLLLVAGLGFGAWFLWKKLHPSTTQGTSAPIIPEAFITTLSPVQKARVSALMNNPNLPRSAADEALITVYMNS